MYFQLRIKKSGEKDAEKIAKKRESRSTKELLVSFSLFPQYIVGIAAGTNSIEVDSCEKALTISFIYVLEWEDDVFVRWYTM